MKLEHVVFSVGVSVPWQEQYAKVAKAGIFREANPEQKRPAETLTITANEGWVFLRHFLGDKQTAQRCVPVVHVVFATPTAEEQRK